MHRRRGGLVTMHGVTWSSTRRREDATRQLPKWRLGESVCILRACVGLAPESHMLLEHKRGMAEIAMTPDAAGSTKAITKKQKILP